MNRNELEIIKRYMHYLFSLHFQLIICYAEKFTIIICWQYEILVLFLRSLATNEALISSTAMLLLFLRSLLLTKRCYVHCNEIMS